MRIVDAGQFISLEGPDAGKLQCRITIRTDDGRQGTIDTNEETVNQILGLLTGGPNSSAESTLPVTDGRYATPTVTPEESAAFFGGVAEAAPTIGVLTEEAPIQEEPPPTGLGHGVSLDSKGYPVRGRSRHVDKDEYGYPIVPKQAETAPLEDEEDPGEQI